MVLAGGSGTCKRSGPARALNHFHNGWSGCAEQCGACRQASGVAPAVVAGVAPPPPLPLLTHSRWPPFPTGRHLMASALQEYLLKCVKGFWQLRVGHVFGHRWLYESLAWKLPSERKKCRQPTAAVR